MYNANLIFPKGSYTNSDVISNVINYIFGMTKKSRKGITVGCYGIFPPTAHQAIAQFQTVRLQNKNFPVQQLWHFCISISEQIDKYSLHKYADQIAYTIGTHYQICYGIHLDTGHPHIHFAVSTCSYIVGYPDLTPQTMHDYISEIKCISSTCEICICQVEIKEPHLLPLL